MQTLTIDPSIPFVIPAGPLAVAVIGCGGTGSHIAQSLARLAAHCRDAGLPPLQIALVDGDRVEQKNVGRQLFSAADVGKNKAQVLAARLSTVFGLEVVAFPEMLNGQHIVAHTFGILVGAVDNPRARREIGRELERPNGRWKLWIDCGNHEHSGQVVVGTTLDAKGLKGSLALGGICTALPTAPLIYPALVEEVEQIVTPLDCARAMEQNAQSLMVNQAMAAVAAQYLYQIVIERRLTTYRTTIDLKSLTMSSKSITAANLAADLDMQSRALRTAPKRKKAA